MIHTVPKSLAIGLLSFAQLSLLALLGWISYERTMEEEMVYLSADARAAANRISQAMQLVDVELTYLQELTEVHPNWVDTFDDVAIRDLARATEAAPHIGAAGIVNADGVMTGLVLRGGELSARGLDVSDRSYFEVQRSGTAEGTFLSEPIQGRVRGRWILVASRAFVGPDGRFGGIVLTSVVPSSFAEDFNLLSQLPIERRVLTGQGQVLAIAGPAADGDKVESLDQLPSSDSNQSLEAGFIRSPNAGGNDSLVAIAPVPGWPIVATSSLEMDEILSGWRLDLTGLAAALGLTLTALIVLILNLYKHQALTSEREQRFRSLIEEAIDGVVIHDADGFVFFANDAMAQILGLSYGHELQGRRLEDFIPQASYYISEARWRKIQETGQPVTTRRSERVRPDGKSIFIDISSQQIDWQGRFAIRSTINEVTDQVFLADRERRQAAVLAAVNDAHSIYLNQTRGQAIFDRLLQKILDLTSASGGYIAEKMGEDGEAPYLRTLARSNMSSESGDEIRSLDNLLGEALRGGHITIIDDMEQQVMPLGLQSGDFVLQNLMVLPLAQEDEVLGVLTLVNRSGGFDAELAYELAPIVQAIIRIVSDFRSNRLREAAEQASRSKSVFLAHMSHELRTPLSGVIANMELLRGTRLDTEQTDLVEASMTAGKGLLGVIGNTLDFSKIEADELLLDMTEFDPRAMVEDVQSIFLGAATDRGLDLFIVIDPLVPQKVRADEMRLRQVLSNLVGNAIKFTDKGRIGIFLSATRISGARAQLNLSVDDTGVGFDPSKADGLFRAFGQESGSTARKFGGTGLGLTIAHRLVDLHGGEITCHAQPGEGSSFVATIPVAVSEWRKPEAPSMAGHSITLLFPTGDLPDDLVTGLEALGAEVHQTSQTEDLAEIIACLTDRRRSLVIDWDSCELDSEDIVDRYGAAFQQILAVGSRHDPDRRRRALFVDPLHPIIKPLSAVSLSLALHGGDRAGTRPVDEQESQETLCKAFTPDQAPRVLVAEDQPMNQMVLKRQLKRLGVDCDIAENGAEALQRLEEAHYDVLITDCSMPVMDGFELSRALRQLETEGRPRSAIIALTANAVSGDAQRCYDAGMDAYLSKPASLAELSKVLRRCGRAGRRDDDSGGAGEAPAASKVNLPEAASLPIDRQAMAELLGEDDSETIDAMILEFFESWQACMTALREPWQQKDGGALKAAAHAAKGTARYGMAEILAETCQSLENLAVGEEWQGAERLIQSLEAETIRLRAYLETSGLLRDEETQSA